MTDLVLKCETCPNCTGEISCSGQHQVGCPLNWDNKEVTGRTAFGENYETDGVTIFSNVVLGSE